MKTNEKKFFRYFIISNDKNNIFDFEKNFFALDMIDINRLDKYAEIFKIESNNGISRARKLWQDCQKCYEQKPF